MTTDRTAERKAVVRFIEEAIEKGVTTVGDVHKSIAEGRSMRNAARRCQVRVVSTEPWLICESGGLRFLLPEALAVAGRTAEQGSVLIPDWAFNELAAARACIDRVTRESSIPTTLPSPEGRRSAAASARTSRRIGRRPDAPNGEDVGD
jgi:hypothetical protein